MSINIHFIDIFKYINRIIRTPGAPVLNYCRRRIKQNRHQFTFNMLVDIKRRTQSPWIDRTSCYRVSVVVVLSRNLNSELNTTK